MKIAGEAKDHSKRQRVVKKQGSLPGRGMTLIFRNSEPHPYITRYIDEQGILHLKLFQASTFFLII